MSARDEVLARVRAALGAAPEVPPVPRRYRTGGDLPAGHPALLDLLVDRLEDYRATVHRTSATDLPTTLARVLAGRSASTVVVPPGLPDGWTGEAQVRVDTGDLTPADLDAVDGVITAVAVAVAETGTLVLDGSPDQGRRAITLVPDLHVCVLRAEQVVATVPEALHRLDPSRPLTFVSGPSATSDIELDRVEGVHGPRTLDVVLVSGD